jgi:hypothetical protein
MQQTATELVLDLSRSYLVSDAGVAAGCHTILVKTRCGLDSLDPYRDLWAEVEPNLIAADILEAARLIIGQPMEGPNRWTS